MSIPSGIEIHIFISFLQTICKAPQVADRQPHRPNRPTPTRPSTLPEP